MSLVRPFLVNSVERSLHQLVNLPHLQLVSFLLQERESLLTLDLDDLQFGLESVELGDFFVASNTLKLPFNPLPDLGAAEINVFIYLVVVLLEFQL